MSTAPVLTLDPPPVDQAWALLQDWPTTLEAMTASVVSIPSEDLAQHFSMVAAAQAWCDALKVAVMLEADSRGVISSSDAGSVRAWTRDAADAAGVHATPAETTAMADLAKVARLPGLAPLTEAVTSTRLPVGLAGLVAAEFSKVRAQIPAQYWDACLTGFIDLAASGAPRVRVSELADLLISQYSTAETLEEKAAQSHQRRSMSVFHRTRLGDYEAKVVLDAESMAVVEAALDALSRPDPQHPTNTTTTTTTSGSSPGGSAAGGAPRDERTPGQRRADALVAACAMVAGSGRHPKAQVVVTMGFEDLKERCGFGMTATGHPLSPESVRVFACDAQIIPIVLGGQGEVVDVGRAARLATAAQVTVLRQRDRGCSFPGCDRPAGWCDAHHIKHWIDGGATDLLNLALLCRHHHTVVHRRGYTATVTPEGVVWDTDLVRGKERRGWVDPWTQIHNEPEPTPHPQPQPGQTWEPEPEPESGQEWEPEPGQEWEPQQEQEQEWEPQPEREPQVEPESQTEPEPQTEPDTGWGCAGDPRRPGDAGPAPASQWDTWANRWADRGSEPRANPRVNPWADRASESGANPEGDVAEDRPEAEDADADAPTATPLWG